METSDNVDSSTNITSDQIDLETTAKLRGDAIGSTMYSEVFVLNTLLQFSDLKWSKEVEDNLCFMWDMTEEQDVCEYLFKVSYPALACTAIQRYREPRFIEIVVGILANLLCSQCEGGVTEDQTLSVLNLLDSDDPYILTQVMRFIHAVSFKSEKISSLRGDHMERFYYILKYSENKELLSATLKTLSSITDNKVNEVIKSELISSAVTGYKVLKGSDGEIFESEEQQTNIKHLLQIVCNLCTYTPTSRVNELKEELTEFSDEIIVLLNFYREEDNLLPLDERCLFYLEALTYIYRIVCMSYNSLIARSMYEIFYILYKKDRVKCDAAIEMLCYFISVGNLELFKQDFSDLPPAQIKDALSYIADKRPTFEFDYSCNLNSILDSL